MLELGAEVVGIVVEGRETPTSTARTSSWMTRRTESTETEGRPEVEGTALGGGVSAAEEAGEPLSRSPMMRKEHGRGKNDGW